MNAEELAYIEKHKLKKLAGYGDDALYQSPWGARTISDILEMSKLRPPKPIVYPAQIEVSEQLMLRHLRCVEDHGCGLL